MGTPYRVRGEPGRENLTPVPARPLGRLRSSHSSGTTGRRVLLGATAVTAVFAVLTLAWPHAVGLVLTAFVLAIVIGTWLGLAVLLGLDVVVRVHEGGLVVERSLRSPRPLPFDAVRTVYFEPHSKYVLVLDDGKRIELPTRVTEEPRLQAVVETELERPVLDGATEAFARGEVLSFGRIALELDGLRHADDLLPWSDLDRVRVDDGGFVFVQKATRHSFVVLPMSAVPFPRVLVALLARRTRVEADDSFWTRWVRA
jgi:hypothetical protein